LAPRAIIALENDVDLLSFLVGKAERREPDMRASLHALGGLSQIANISNDLVGQALANLSNELS